MDWKSADEFCKSDSHGTVGYSGLVTIWSNHEAQFVYSYFHAIDQPVWLGMTFLTDPASGTTEFLWNDNFPVISTFWGNGQPTASNSESGCVQFDKNGTWAVSESCTSQLTPFF